MTHDEQRISFSFDGETFDLVESRGGYAVFGDAHSTAFHALLSSIQDGRDCIRIRDVDHRLTWVPLSLEFGAARHLHIHPLDKWPGSFPRLLEHIAECLVILLRAMGNGQDNALLHPAGGFPSGYLQFPAWVSRLVIDYEAYTVAAFGGVDTRLVVHGASAALRKKTGVAAACRYQGASFNEGNRVHRFLLRFDSPVDGDVTIPLADLDAVQKWVNTL